MLLSKNLIDSVLPSNLKQLLDEGGAGKSLECLHILFSILSCVNQVLCLSRKLEHCRREFTAEFESV